MRNLLTSGRGVARAALGVALGLAAARPAAAQQTFDACYVPDVGAIYLINETGLPATCLSTDHVAISWTEGETDHGALAGLADDDHTQYLLADGVRDATDGFAVTGTLSEGVIPVEGAGVRLMWYPHKAAFRAGWAQNTEWDDANVGLYSTALGLNTTASNISSTALGAVTTASGGSATALGSFTTASGNWSTAMGGETTASGSYSTAMGRLTTAQAYASLVIGRFNVIAGDQTGWLSTQPLFVAGNGTSTTPSNALTLFKNGTLAIAGSLIQNSDIRLKQDVEPVERALDGVLQLTPIRYRFRAGTGHPTERQIGLSAQEVEPLFPELVQRDAQGYLSVAYTDLAAVLVRAIQEQQARIDAQDEVIAALRADNAALRDALQRRLAALEAALGGPAASARPAR